MTTSTRPEMAAVLLLLQAGAWILAGLGAVPFALGGEPAMAGLAAFTAALVALALLLAAGLALRRRWARWWTVALEWTCVAGSLLLLVLPVGAPHGPVALLAGLGLPAALLGLLTGRRGRRAFSRT